MSYTCTFKSLPVTSQGTSPSHMRCVHLGQGQEFSNIHQLASHIIENNGGIPGGDKRVAGLIHNRYKEGSQKRRSNPDGSAYYWTRLDLTPTRELPPSHTHHNSIAWQDTYIFSYN